MYYLRFKCSKSLKYRIYYYSRSQQERAKKRMEFDNQCNRIYNQLDFEKQRDTESMLKICYMKTCIKFYTLYEEVFIYTFYILCHYFLHYINITYNIGNVLRWERAVQDAEDKLESAKLTESNQKAEIDHDEQQMEQLKSSRNAKKMEVDQKEDEIGKARREVGAIAKDIQAAQKQLNAIETKIEQKKAERHTILMQCKVC